MHKILVLQELEYPIYGTNLYNYLTTQKPDVHISLVRSLEQAREDENYGSYSIIIASFCKQPSLKAIILENPVKWVASASAGVAQYLFPELTESDILFTKAQGCYSKTLAEHTILSILYFNSSVPQMVQNREERNLQPIGNGTVRGKVLLIVGYGDIGMSIAKQAKAFDMKIIGVKRRVDNPSDEYASEIHPVTQLDSLLPSADFVAMVLPGVQDTTNIFRHDQLSLMKPTAHIINIGRGNCIDEESLVTALNAGTIGGAALDVFATEPLPEDSGLWMAPNLLISPHNADFVTTMAEDFGEVFLENFALFDSGQPLKAKVDANLGY